ncbi:hypothetical protein BT69DRAFT_237586 [Atractiella rhizophila]|nr:hypothetical protein BT69DRAFT_237586 [Atractiella rhizophila]
MIRVQAKGNIASRSFRQIEASEYFLSALLVRRDQQREAIEFVYFYILTLNRLRQFCGFREQQTTSLNHHGILGR